MIKSKEVEKFIREGKRLERICKGPANHWRIAILFLVRKAPNLSVDDITEHLDGNFKNISAHTGKLVSCGLLNKYHSGPQVLHKLSPYGRSFVKLLDIL